MKIEFEREGIVAEARAGQTLLEVAEAAGVELFRGMWPALHCRRRKGWCRRCRVWVGSDDGAPVLALACKVEARDAMRVHTRAGGPPPGPSLQTGAPAWKNAVSARPDAVGAPKDKP